MNTNTPPVIKGAINALGKETANIGQAYSNATKGLQATGAKIRSNIQAGQSSPNSGKANYSINPLAGTGIAKAVQSAGSKMQSFVNTAKPNLTSKTFKKAKRK